MSMQLTTRTTFSHEEAAQALRKNVRRRESTRAFLIALLAEFTEDWGQL
jgi:hypothetical protein